MLLEKIDLNKLREIAEVFFGCIGKENFESVISTTLSQLKEDEKYYLPHNISLENPSSGLYALTYYRMLKVVTNYIQDPLEKVNLENKITRYMLKEFSCYLSPYSHLGKGIVLLGINIFVENNATIKENCTLYSNVVIGTRNNNNDTKGVLIDKNCIIKNNVVILGNVAIGRNVVVGENVVLRENISDDCKVEIINQLMVKHEKVSKLPSQSTIVYGITPKFKNTIIIHGESFYNPKVIIRNAHQKEVAHEITYWDKNKIMVKIKYAKYEECDVKGSVLVLMSNGNKVTLINNFALEKTLSKLSE